MSAENANPSDAYRRGAWMVTAVVSGVLLAIGTVGAVAFVTFYSDLPGTSWSLLLVPLVGVGVLYSGRVGGRAKNPRTVRRAQLAVIAGIAYFGTCIALVVWVLAGYKGN